MSGELNLIQNSSNTAVDTVEVFYTADNGIVGVEITKFTAVNNSGSSVSFKGYIYDSTGGLVDAIIPMTIVVKDKFNPGYSAVGHLIPPGGSLRLESSAAGGLNYFCTGRVISS